MPDTRTRTRARARARSRIWACLTLACLSLTTPAQGERGGGINADLAVDEALQALDRQNTHNTQLTNTLTALREREQVVQSALRVHVRALYRVTRNGSAPVAGGFPAVRSYLARVRRLKTMVVSDIAALGSVRREHNVAREQVRQGQRDLTTAQEQLTQLRAAAAALPPRVQTRVDRPDSEVDRGFYGLRLSSGTTLTAFEELRGKLAAPISGELRMRDVKRDNASALLFEATAGTSVRTSAAGRVVFCDAHSVVVDHGGGYQTAYGQLGNVDVRNGDELSALARIGDVADAPEPALLFEVRKGSRSVPPRAWLGL